MWDATNIPECDLRFGGPTGTVMPLLWAHSEYLKIRRSLRDGVVFDSPPLPGRPSAIWRVDRP